MKNKKGIQELISNLDEEINYSCYHLSIIKDLDYITHDLIKPKDLEIVIDRNFENDDCYDKKYYELFLRYKLLDYELTNYYEKCKEVNHDLDMT